MRLLFTLLLLPLLLGPALAEEAPSTPIPAAPASDKRLTWQQHFAQANLAHDGHLTPAEARTGYPLLAKHFDDIDADHKGYITQDDVKAWRTMRSAARRLAHRPDPLKPRRAFQVHTPVGPPLSTTRVASVPARVPPAVRATKIGD